MTADVLSGWGQAGDDPRRDPQDRRPGDWSPRVRGRPLGAAAGILLDRALGEPPTGWPHPVALFGTFMLAVEDQLWREDRDRARARTAGMAHAALGLGVGALAGAAARSTATTTYVAVAGRLLHDTALDVAAALDAGHLDEARRRLPALAGRDPSGMDAAEIVRAVVESVAENTVDAIVAPALWAALLGGAGALGYRAVNTMDAMVGHRSDRYEQYGWASARLDDAAGWLPARATAALVAAVRPAAARDVWRTVRRDAPAHPSPNSGVAEAAFAAALGVRLGGTNRYGDRVEHRPTLGNGPPPLAHDIHHAVRLSRDVQLALAAALTAIGVADACRRPSTRRAPARRWLHAVDEPGRQVLAICHSPRTRRCSPSSPSCWRQTPDDAAPGGEQPTQPSGDVAQVDANHMTVVETSHQFEVGAQGSDKGPESGHQHVVAVLDLGYLRLCRPETRRHLGLGDTEGLAQRGQGDRVLLGPLLLVDVDLRDKGPERWVG